MKKFFEPAERQNPFLYMLLPIAVAALWELMLWLLPAVGYDNDLNIDFYPNAIIGFLPYVLLALLPPLIVCRLGLKKRVGEAYCVYVLSFFGVLMFPTTVAWALIMCGV